MSVKFTVAEVAKKLRIHRQTAYKLIWNKEIGHSRHGKKILIPEEEFKAYEKRNFRPAASAATEDAHAAPAD